MDIRIGKRAQVVIPAAVRRRLGLEEGDLLRLEVDERGRIVLEAVPEDPLERLRSAGKGLWASTDPVAEHRRLRSEWDR